MVASLVAFQQEPGSLNYQMEDGDQQVAWSRVGPNLYARIMIASNFNKNWQCIQKVPTPRWYNTVSKSSMNMTQLSS